MMLYLLQEIILKSSTLEKHKARLVPKIGSNQIREAVNIIKLSKVKEAAAHTPTKLPTLEITNNEVKSVSKQGCRDAPTLTRPMI
jgi:hypothetical protein